MKLAEEVAALRTAAGFWPRPEVYTLVLEGPDRVRFLNGMVTNDVAKLEPGTGHASIKATPRGRVEGVLRVRCLASALHVEVEETTAQAVATSLSQMVIVDDVTLSDGTPQRAVIALYGPKSAEALALLGLPIPAELHAFNAQQGVTVIRDDLFGPEGFELHVPADGLDDWQRRLSDAQAVSVSADAADVVRIEFGRPRDGVDIDADTIPMEARLEAALDFTKGCFVGQEVIARAHNLGGVKHHLVGLDFGSETPPPVGAHLVADADGKATGEVTSAVYSPTLNRAIGLGFVRVAHESPGTVLTIRADGSDGAAALGQAKVATLPFS